MMKELENHMTLQEKQQMDLYTIHTKNELDIQKKQAMTGIAMASRVEQAMNISDVAAEKELQKTMIGFLDGGGVALIRERFGSDLKGRLPIKIVSAALYSHFNDAKASVLSMIIKKENDEECFLFWNLRKMETRYIRIPFEENGISFGFGEKKENEIRRKLLLAVINTASTTALPERHGWYKLDGRWRYAYPEELTWKEVNEHC